MMSSEEMFNSIYKRFMPLVRVIARKYRISPADVDDVIQEVFISFYRAYPLDLPEKEICRLLAEITNNRCIDYLRKLKTHPEQSYDPVILQEELQSKDYYHNDGLAVLIEKQKHAEIAATMKSMKKEWVEVFCLKVIEDRSFAEVSEILGISNAACRKRLQRGREHLRAYMERLREEEAEWELQRRNKTSKDTSAGLEKKPSDA